MNECRELRFALSILTPLLTIAPAPQLIEGTTIKNYRWVNGPLLSRRLSMALIHSSVATSQERPVAYQMNPRLDPLSVAPLVMHKRDQPMRNTQPLQRRYNPYSLSNDGSAIRHSTNNFQVHVPTVSFPWRLWFVSVKKKDFK